MGLLPRGAGRGDAHTQGAISGASLMAYINPDTDDIPLTPEQVEAAIRWLMASEDDVLDAELLTE